MSVTCLDIGAVAAIVVGAILSPVLGDEVPKPLHEVIDDAVAERWTAERLAPAELASDAEFLRRVSLDLTGTIPTSAATRAFLDDATPGKRTRLIDALLASPEYARHMQHVFDVMLIERQHANYVTADEWDEYLRASFAENKPWDQMARELLGADGTDPKTRPAMRFFLARTVDSYRVMNPNALTRDVGRLFLGVNLQCAQCHDHPTIADFKQADYYGILAFVQRTYIMGIKLENKDVMVLAEKPDGEVRFTSVFDKTKTERKTTPRLPGFAETVEPAVEKGKEFLVPPKDGVRPVPAYSRREQLVRLLPAPDNVAFQRNMANRLWAMMMGRGLVDPPDVTSADNPPSHPVLLDALAGRFAAGKFDIKALLREIALSRTYQLSSRSPAGSAAAPPDSFAVAPLKPLRAEQLLFATHQATGATDAERLALGSGAAEPALYRKVAGFRTAFATLYGAMPGQADGRFESSLEQALYLSNNDLVLGWIRPRPGNLADRLGKLTSSAAIADELYISVFTRLPDRDETIAVAGFIQDRAADRADAIAELIWSMIASTEFRFNH
jgi:hypothetical protein